MRPEAVTFQPQEGSIRESAAFFPFAVASRMCPKKKKQIPHPSALRAHGLRMTTKGKGESNGEGKGEGKGNGEKPPTLRFYRGGPSPRTESFLFVLVRYKVS